MARTTARRPARTAAPARGADHAALGAAALQMRQAKRYDEALDLYRQAADAAQAAGEAVAQATWVSKQGNIHRLRDDPAAAEQAYRSAFDKFEALGDAGLAGLADQEGGFGLLAADRGDDWACEFAYRRAIELAQAARAWGTASLWSHNLGNALTRRRRYLRATEAYQHAIDWAREAGDAASAAKAALGLYDACAQAGRWSDAAAALDVAAACTDKPATQARCALDALRALMRAGAWTPARDRAPDTLALLRRLHAPEDACREAQSIGRDAQRALDAEQRQPAPPWHPPLDDVAVGAMAHYEESGSAGTTMAWVGHLVADIHCGLNAPRFDEWRRFFSEPELHYRILGDVMAALCRDERPEDSFLLSQRIKGTAFARPFLAQARTQAATEPALRAYLDAHEALHAAVDALAAARPHQRHPLAQRVRAAGEALLEAGELLADVDRDLLARLGGPVAPRHLLDALPAGDPVCLLDVVVTTQGLLVHAVLRDGAQARVVAISAPELSASALRELALLWGPDMVRAADLDRHRQVLDHIGQVLHDRLFCHLAHWVTEQRVGQVIIVPDLLTRHLPLHLARVCAKDLAIPGVPTDGAEYFCEVLPVEYAPCVQAVALSQHQRRPANIARVASFADAQGDLPGARYTSTWLRGRISKDPAYIDRAGAEVTRAAVEDELRQSALLLVGTHGLADAQQPERSCLQLHDGAWTAADIAALPPLAHSPAVILAACEVGAANPGDDPAADGVPGALLAAGAAFVLGSRWPGEDVSMGLLIERFLHHARNIGLRPAAVLFRAVRDLRRLGRADALARCRDLLEQMRRDGLHERDPDAYARLDWFALQIEDGAREHPFEAPFYWGGVVVIGSGWSGMAGGAAGLERILKGQVEIESARDRLAQGQARTARDAIEPWVGQLDGVLRVQALELMAQATAQAAHPACRATALAEANAWLDEAQFVARAEQRPQLLRNLDATRAKLKLLLDD